MTHQRHSSFVFVIAALFMTVGIFASCSREQENSEEQREIPTEVVIIKFATHPALDATETGIIDVLRSAKENDPTLSELTWDVQNAAKSRQLAKQLAENATRSDVAVIVAIATPAAQAVAKTPSEIPMVYAAVSDPDGAGLLDGGRATGSKNVGDNTIKTALEFMRDAFPSASRLGTIYNPAEQNSLYVQGMLSDFAPDYGFELVQREVHNPTQIASTTELLAKEVDVMYSANDNTINSGIASVIAVSRAEGIPFILGDLSTLSRGATVAIGLDYIDVGRDAGNIVLKLMRGTPLEDLPPQGAPQPQIWLNLDAMKELGIDLPEPAMQRIDKMIGE